MRWLITHPGPHFSVADVLNGWREGLQECGETVRVYNLHDRLALYEGAHVDRGDGQYVKALDAEQAIQLAQNGLLSACYQYWPDVLLVVSGFFIAPELLDLIRSRGTRVVLLHTESPYEDDKQLIRAAHADLNLLNDPTNLERFRAVAPTIYQPHCYRPSVHQPIQAPAEWDFSFVGTGYPSRVAFLEQVDWRGLRVALGGNWRGLQADSPLTPFLLHEPDECLDNEDAAQLYAASKVGANLYRREANAPDLVDGWAMGPREVEMAAAGIFFLRDRRGENELVLPMLPAFDGPEEFGDLLRYWSAHDTERRDIASKAREAVADRSFVNSAAALLQRLAA